MPNSDFYDTCREQIDKNPEHVKVLLLNQNCHPESVEQVINTDKI